MADSICSDLSHLWNSFDAPQKGIFDAVGEAKGFLRDLLKVKFTSRPTDLLSQINNAELNPLDLWIQKANIAASVHEVFR